jgi:Transposase, Mutator family
VAQCGDANDLLLKVDSYPLDIAIVDIRLPPTHSDEGLRAALEIRARHPSVGVLVCRSTVQHLREARHPLDRERVSARAGGVDVPPRLTRGGPQYPTRHRRRWRSTNLLERSLAEVKRRTKVIGRFPGETSCLTLVWAVLDLYITHAKNGVRFSRRERQRLRRMRHAGSQPTTARR